MPMVKWDPFSNIATLQDRINRLFDDAFPGPAEGDEDMTDFAWRPMVDIYEVQDGAVIKVDLPGVVKSDVAVEVKENILTIRGERKIDSSIPEERYYRRERTCGKFQRSFALRSMISPDNIKASFKSGVLTVEIPKPEVEKPKQVSVSID